MIALDLRARTALGAVSIALLAASAAVTPRVARGEPVAMYGPSRPAGVRAASLAAALPRRDPFAGGGPPAQANAQPPDPSARAEVKPPAAPPLRLPEMPLPPTGIADPAERGADQRPRVSAIVTGTRPYAVVDEGGRIRVITLGDSLAGDRVTAIGARAVRLARGPVLSLDPPSSRPPENDR